MEKKYVIMDESQFEKLATKQDLAGFATRQDLAGFATRQDLAEFATRQDIVDIRQDIVDIKQDIVDIKQDIVDIKQGFYELKIEFRSEMHAMAIRFEHGLRDNLKWSVMAALTVSSIMVACLKLF